MCDHVSPPTLSSLYQMAISAEKLGAWTPEAYLHQMAIKAEKRKLRSRDPGRTGLGIYGAGDPNVQKSDDRMLILLRKSVELQTSIHESQRMREPHHRCGLVYHPRHARVIGQDMCNSIERTSFACQPVLLLALLIISTPRES